MNKLLTRTGLLAGLGLVALAGQAQTVDGTRDASYPAALAVQTVGTQFGNNTTGSQYAANGEELDNIHAQIVGSDLFLFIGGNLNSSFDKLDLFFDTKAGGQNVLANNPNYVGSMAGLQFDAGFAADYALSVTCGNATATNLEIYADYVNLPTGGAGSTSAYINTGGSAAGPVQPLTFSNSVPGAGTGLVSINNSNVLGVSSGTGAANTAAATAVGTGIEYRIPLTALGTTMSGGDIKIIAFINNSGHNYLSNQVLAGLPAGTDNLGSPGTINFGSATYTGNQYVTVTNGSVATPADISVSPGSLSFYNVATVGGSVTRSLAISNNGGAPLSVTSIVSNNAAFTVPATSATVAPAATIFVNVTFDPSVAGAQSGTISIASDDPGTPTTVIPVSGTGVAPGNVVLDGTVDPGGVYTVKALQTTGTGFGNNLSELDGAYVRTTATDLYLTLTGNLEANFNKLVIFFDANPTTGQNTIAAVNPVTESSGNLAGLRFDRGFAPESFLSIRQGGGSLYASFVNLTGAAGFGTDLSPATHEFTQALDFGGGVMGELSLNNNNTGGVDGTNPNSPGTVQTGVEIRIPLSALGAGITATTPIHVMPIVANGNYDYLSNQTLGGLPLGTGNLGVNGSGGGSLPYTVDFLNYAGNQFFTAQRGDVTVGNARDLAGDYNNITISAAGNASVYSPLNVSGTLSDLGTLQFQAPADAVVSGTGTVAVGNNGAVPAGNLVVSSSAGISAAGNTGNVQTSGRNFGSSAQYAYGNLTGAAMVTGSGLPANVFGLAVGTAATLSLSQALAVSGTVALTSTGNLNTNGQALTLRSGASGTALVANVGTGTVQGTTAVQRYIDPALYPYAGYHHFSAPVGNTTVADFAAGGTAPVVNPALNTAANPGIVRPFPTVQAYDEGRVLTSPALTLSPFDKGFFSPAALTDPLQVGRGYAVNVGAGQVTDLVGTLTTGDQAALSLPRTGGVDGGWNFVGNPYPAPLNYNLVAAGDRSGLDAAMYVWQATSQFGGMYRSYVPGAPVTASSNPIIASSQAFWTRTSSAAAAGSLTFRNSQRVVDIATPTNFQRNTADTRPVLELALATAGLPADVLTVYADPRATSGLDAQYDALKLPNPNGLNLAAQATGLRLAFDARPVLTAATRIPLDVRVPAAGSYTLTAATLRNVPAGLTAYLVDALTGQRTALTQATAYRFSLTAAQAAAPGTGRFSLEFAGTALATAAALEGAGVTLYPNPAHGTATLLVPAVAGTSQVTVGLYNGLGQLVRNYPAAALPAAGLRTELPLSGVAAGIYTVRLTAGGSTISKKLVVE